jgi:quercetin dioxygenase-like cupin family protein
MEARTLQLSPHERVEVLEHDPARLVLSVHYDPRGRPPPRHLHPRQEEQFEVLSGVLMVELDGPPRPHHPGEPFTVPAGSVHRLWNPFDAPATARWTTSPAGRTLDMFRQIDALHRDGRTPGPLRLARIVAGYPEQFRLAGPAGRVLSLLPRGATGSPADRTPRSG